MSAPPLTISTTSGCQFNWNSQFGPFLGSNGAIYVLLRDRATLDDVEVWKQTSDGAAFTKVATWTLVGEFISCWGVAVGDTIHIACVDTANVRYRTFSMATDTWGVAETVVTSSGGACSLAVRSNGDVIVVHAGSATVKNVAYGRVRYSRRVNGTWTTNIAVDAGGEINYRPQPIFVGAADMLHLFWYAPGTSQGFQRSLSAGNVLGTQVQWTSTTSGQIMQGASWVEGGVTKVRGLHVVPDPNNVDTYPAYEVEFDSAATPTITYTKQAAYGAIKPESEDAHGARIVRGADGTRWVYYSDEAAPDETGRLRKLEPGAANYVAHSTGYVHRPGAELSVAYLERSDAKLGIVYADLTNPEGGGQPTGYPTYVQVDLAPVAGGWRVGSINIG